MAVTRTQRTYQFSEFTSATVINVTIFWQELMDDSSVVEKPGSVAKSGTTVVVEWTDVTVSQGTIDAVDADVAAHVGGAYAEPPLKNTDESESYDDSGDEQTKVSLDSGLLPEGQYLFGWYAEIKTDGEVPNTGAVARLYVDANGGGEEERGFTSCELPQYISFGGSFPKTVDAGEQYSLRLAYEKLGAQSNPAYMRRARLSIVKTD